MMEVLKSKISDANNEKVPSLIKSDNINKVIKPAVKTTTLVGHEATNGPDNGERPHNLSPS